MRDSRASKSHLEKKKRNEKGICPWCGTWRNEYLRQPWSAANDQANPRGSFPLDHDGECKKAMTSYLACMKKVRGVNEDECRNLAKAYLSCRMDRNLMARDEFKNLGFADPALAKAPAEPEKGVKGELRW
ncbi:hypothetical protein THARTR1_02224 [Trichoderma harzianum]|uniref:Cytochrome c oxidase assembly protein COX19 n=1 Tax=Trichoderma harzianum TaxID=5544 RepID=A0A2K0UK16_TRIHA|nr:hypothetical protein THARTR1_02224 [Trichoderma harzianum]